MYNNYIVEPNQEETKKRENEGVISNSNTDDNEDSSTENTTNSVTDISMEMMPSSRNKYSNSPFSQDILLSLNVQEKETFPKKIQSNTRRFENKSGYSLDPPTNYLSSGTNYFQRKQGRESKLDNYDVSQHELPSLLRNSYRSNALQKDLQNYGFYSLPSKNLQNYGVFC